MVEKNIKQENGSFHILELLGGQLKPCRVGKYEEVIENEPGSVVSFSS
jgi:hypothetical protein